MDPADTTDWLARRLVALMEPDTTSGREDRGLDVVVDVLREQGAEVTTQAVDDGSTNVLATWGRPRFLFTTHLDTVPPFLPPRRDGDVVWGRGACDAKGQMVAHLLAIRGLLDAGHDGFAWLGVCREETDGAGAWKALELRDRLADVRGILNGEPTENRLGAGQRGFLHLRLTCRGRPAHSGTPELGRSATWMLVDWLQALRAEGCPVDPDLGPEVWNLGVLAGGEAINVIPERATAEVLVRSLPGSNFEARARALCPDGGAVELVTFDPPDRFPRLPGHDPVPLTFGSDLPKLRRLVGDRPVALVGPGSIAVAHTEREHVRLDDLARGAAQQRALALEMLAISDRPPADGAGAAAADDDDAESDA